MSFQVIHPVPAVHKCKAREVTPGAHMNAGRNSGSRPQLTRRIWDRLRREPNSAPRPATRTPTYVCVCVREKESWKGHTTARTRISSQVVSRKIDALEARHRVQQQRPQQRSGGSIQLRNGECMQLHSLEKRNISKGRTSQSMRVRSERGDGFGRSPTATAIAPRPPLRIGLRDSISVDSFGCTARTA